MIHPSPGEPSPGFSPMIVPGAGQAFAGAWRRGLVLFALFAFGAVPVLVVAAVPVRAVTWLLEGRLLFAALAVNIFPLASGFSRPSTLGAWARSRRACRHSRLPAQSLC